MPKQQRLNGMADAAIEELEEAAEKYLNLQDNRKGYQEKERDQRDLLVHIMQRNGKSKYRHNGLLILADVKSNVKVWRVAKEEEV